MGPKPARFVFAVAMALTILAVMTWAMAEPSSSIYPTYQPIAWVASSQMPRADRRALGVARGRCQADRPAKAGASPHKQASVRSPRRGLPV